MTENSRIEWTHHTLNPWVGCTKISPGCDHCYAESWAKRAGSPALWNGQRRRTSAANWREPIKWNARCAAAGIRERVFCASLADVFDNAVPDEWRTDLLRLIHATPHLDWLLLTKRIGNAAHMLDRAMLEITDAAVDWDDAPLPNVWIGATVVNQDEADRDAPKLGDVKARVRFLSIEPLLGEIDFAGLWIDLVDARVHENVLERIDWIIVGGESGGKARPMEVAWASLIQAQCEALGVAFFMKQGSAANWPDFKNFASFPRELQVRQWPT